MAATCRGTSTACSAATVTAVVLITMSRTVLASGGREDDGAAKGGIYFPLRSVELKLWVDGKSGNLLPPPEGVLLVPLLLNDMGGAETASVTFRLTDPARPGQTPALPWLSVDAKTGVLKVTEQRVLGETGAQRQHVVWLEARGPATLRAPPQRSGRPFMVPADRARIVVTITFELVQEDRPCLNKPQGAQVARDDPCHYCHDSCFWQRAELQVWENKPATRLAPLGHSYANVHCGEGQQHTLKNGTEHFEIRGAELWSKELLDRDVLYNASTSERGPGPHVLLNVECRTPWGATEERVVSVFVLDEDDNAPEIDKDEKLVFNFSTEAALSRGAHILVKDMDSRAANRFGELQVTDPSGVVAHKKLEFDVTHGGVQHTLISIRLQVKDPMEAHYKILLILTDLTLSGQDDKKDLRMNVTLWGPPLTPPVAMSSSGTAGAASADSTPGAQGTSGPARSRRDAAAVGSTKESKSDESPVRVWRHANVFARLKQVGKVDDGLDYSLAETPPSTWAGVTKTAGIVYVVDPQKLYQLDNTVTPLADLNLVVRAKDPVSGATVRVHHVPVQLAQQVLPEGEALNCTDKDRKKNCAQHKKRDVCEHGCGVGSGGPGSGRFGGCVWREGRHTKNVIGNYSTCSVHLGTCPNGVCDPLEKLDANICPQDCTGASRASFAAPAA